MSLNDRLARELGNAILRAVAAEARAEEAELRLAQARAEAESEAAERATRRPQGKRRKS